MGSCVKYRFVGWPPDRRRRGRDLIVVVVVVPMRLAVMMREDVPNI